MKKLTKLAFGLLNAVAVFSLLSCNGTNGQRNTIADLIIGNDNEERIAVKEGPEGDYNEGVVLVKSSSLRKKDLKDINYKGCEQLYPNSKWYKIALSNPDDTEKAISSLRQSGKFEEVDYDYVMESDGAETDVAGNPGLSSQTYLDTLNIYDAWDYMDAHGAEKGGSPSVVVAVIDTGVDYNHLDLIDNIWVNSAEIPNNGIDDDGNGYIDDYYGWDCVGNDNDPMDDNGHGTHVAGIIAAENNDIGTVGVAYNCKIMCVKAGNSSGYFTNSDIAEAIQYAYMNGASVINMSFGGYALSSVVEDALQDAYNSCILVAAAGNDSLCNVIGCLYHEPATGVSYPGALPYVVGVMSSNAYGTRLSSYSNFDHYPYNNVEYEVCAPGEQILSTWPNNKLNTLSGTSMASPVVAGIAALLRSTYTDREVYSTKFILSQIINNGNELYGGHSFVDALSSLSELPKPNVANLYDYYTFDNVKYSSVNNGDGVIDAGETIRLAIELRNIGGLASNVTAKVDTVRDNDKDITDPYLTFTKDTITMSDIGTYSVRDCEKIYTDNVVTGTVKYFEFVVSEKCPNDYSCNINLKITYTNGLDSSDTTIYSGKTTIGITIQKGYVLPESITEDTVFTNEKRYFLYNDCVIASGVTVTFEEGCEIQFYPSSSSYYGEELKDCKGFKVYGTLNFNGTASSTINISVKEQNEYLPGKFVVNSGGFINMNYVKGKCLWLRYSSGYNSFYINEDNAYRYEADYGEINISNCDLNVSSLNEYTRSIGSGAISSITNSNVEFGDSLYHIDSIKNSSIKLYPHELDGVGRYCTLSVWKCIESIISRAGSHSAHEIEMSIFTSENNAFIDSNEGTYHGCASLMFYKDGVHKNNYFSQGYKNYASQIITNYYGSSGTPIVDINGDCSDYEKLYPFIKNIEVLDAAGNKVNKIGAEEATFRITFSRSMDSSYNPDVYFGSMEPYADYKIEGSFVSSNVWEGKYTLKAFIEGGTQHFRVKNAYAKDADTGYLRESLDNTENFSFYVDMTSAMSMNMNAVASDEGVRLSWNQDDYDTLMGYNVYRSTEKDGYYVKLNQSVIPANENEFLDDNAEPGVTYWYTFTVVFSDLSESAPSGKTSCTNLDTIKPTIYHTPVNQGYTNNNLVISCTASDNISVASVTLYYRTKGEMTYKSLTMVKANSKFSATIYGTDLTTDGVEYYIVASDGTNLTYKGTAENPYSVVIKDSSSIAIKGDVDGDGQITTKDALMIMKAINGDILLTDDQFTKADLNGDGVLTSSEALRILQYINGNVTNLDM